MEMERNFLLFRRKHVNEEEYKNESGNVQNRNGNGIFYAETETKTEQ